MTALIICVVLVSLFAPVVVAVGPVLTMRPGILAVTVWGAEVLGALLAMLVIVSAPQR